jgi:hypothetical protein
MDSRLTRIQNIAGLRLSFDAQAGLLLLYASQGPIHTIVMLIGRPMLPSSSQTVSSTIQNSRSILRLKWAVPRYPHAASF